MTSDQKPQVTVPAGDPPSDLEIEDLTVDYAAVSCDLVSAEPCVHTSGPLWQAIRCSVAVPGLFPPVALDDRLLVDGGLVANLPVGIAANRHPGARLIAVDVVYPTTPSSVSTTTSSSTIATNR